MLSLPYHSPPISFHQLSSLYLVFPSTVRPQIYSMATEYLTIPHAALAIGLLNLLIGNIGADAAPNTLIERILWPQRAYNGFGADSIIKNAFLLSAGGPLHRLAIKTIDQFMAHSLQKGAGRGHMLGTAFFPDTGLAYKLYDSNGRPVEDEWVRNGLLVRILKCIPYIRPTPSGEEGAERRMRQRITVSHLELVNFESVPPENAIALDDDCVSAKTVLAIIASEAPALIFAAAIASYCQSSVALALLAPLALKLLAAATTMQREDLTIPRDAEKSRLHGAGALSRFEVHIPGEGFQVISGPAEVVLPFFRHYGHPIRCRWREVSQMLIIGVLGVSHPLTLATMFFMPVGIQALYAAYQAFLLSAMLAARFGGGDVWGTTEERVGKALVETENHGRNSLVLLRNRTGEMICMKLTRTVHGSYTEGKAQVSRIVTS